MSRGRDKFGKFEKAIRTLTCIYGVFPRSIQIRLLDRNRNTKGYIGLAKRYALLKNLAQHVGENVSIKENVYLYNVEGLSIGDNVSIWPMSYIDAFGGIDIGNDVSMAEGTSIFSFNHSTDDLETSIKDQPVKKLPVKVEDNVWIGSKATVLGGVTVGSGSVIAAGAVVNRDVPRNMIMGGDTSESSEGEKAEMMPITILTATYNHPTELEKLYHSLLNQADINFSWVIIDDGSKKETREVIDNFKQEGKIEVTAIHQENGGKSKAINRGIDLLKAGTEFFVIIDDDEELVPEAITIIKRYYYKYRNEGCGVIHFNRKDENGKVIARPYFENDFFMSYQVHKSKGYHADGYLGYFTQKLGNNRFDIFEGEKYIGPSTLVMKVSGDKNSKLLWASATIGHTEYLEGGITKQGRRLRIKNPQGMIEYCALMQENGASLKNKLIYSMSGYAYMQFVKSDDFDKKNLNKLFSICKTPGYILARKWKKLFMD